MNKLSLWLNCCTVRVVFSVPRISFSYCMVDVQYPAGQGAPAQAALLVAQGIQPADKLAAHGAEVAGGQVAQVVQQVVGQEALSAAEHMAQESQPAVAQVTQQAVGQAQHRELEVEYVYFCHLCVFFINCEQGQGWQPFICLPSLPVFGFPAHSSFMFQSVCLLLLSLYRQF